MVSEMLSIQVFKGLDATANAGPPRFSESSQSVPAEPLIFTWVFPPGLSGEILLKKLQAFLVVCLFPELKADDTAMN